MFYIKNLLKNLLYKFDKKLVNINFYNDAIKNIHKSVNLDLIIELTKNKKKIINYYPVSKSELLQDLFVLFELNFKKKGYFVDAFF